MAYINQRKYYTNDGAVPTDTNWGSYQYVSLDNIMTNFELMYDGNHSLVNNENRYKILFHAKRAIQELNYDAFKEIKALELTVYDDLRFVLPSDYVNWVKLYLFQGNTLRELTENIQVQSSIQYLQNSTAVFGYENGDDSQISVNKLFEDYIYAYIQYAILNSKFGVQEYIINRAKKNKQALLRNAKIRLSNIHPSRLLMNLRGEDKWIK